MNEDNTSPASGPEQDLETVESPVDSPNSPSEGLDTLQSPKVFDISSDNITPFKESEQGSVPGQTPAFDEERIRLSTAPSSPYPILKKSSEDKRSIPLLNIKVPEPASPPVQPQGGNDQLGRADYHRGALPTSPQSDLIRSAPINQVPPVSPAPSVPSTPLKIEQKFVHPEVPRDPHIKALRTYENDVAEAMAQQNASAASIALAESRRQGGDNMGNRPVSNAGRNLFFGVLSLMLIVGGAGIAYYLYLYSPLAPVTEPTREPLVSTIIPVDNRASIIVDNLRPNQIYSRIQEEALRPQAAGTIREIIPAAVKNNVMTRIAAPEMIGLMEIEPPDVIFRSLTPEWMLGVYANPDGTQDPFVIATTDFFSNAFAGMLQWERFMLDDLKHYLYPVAPIGVANITETVTTTTAAAPLIVAGTSTATTTDVRPAIPLTATGAISGRFEDRIIRNKDVRAFRTDEGDILLLYSFLDNKKLAVTKSEAALTEILIRLEREAFIR